MIYPLHIYEKIRVEIGQSYLNHEFHKLFPSIQDPKIWDLINNDIEDWFDKSPNLFPVRDFWNGLDGISRGFKLKNIVARLTSQNIEWSYQEVPLDSLVITASFKELAELGNKPSIQTIRKFYENTELGKEQKANDIATLDSMASTRVMRDEEAITIVGKDKRFEIIDGNRRSWTAMLRGKSTICAAVGEVINDPAIFNIWLPTPILMDLVSFVKRIDPSPASLEAISQTISRLIKTSESGQYEFFNLVTSDTDEELRSKVSNQLKSL